MTDTPHQGQTAPKTAEWIWPKDPQESLQPSVLYFEQECLVVNKPAGLLTQAPPGIPSIEAQARRFFSSLSTNHVDDPARVPREFDYVGVPHRLDRATSGALLLGQSKPVTRKLAAQFENRTIKKIYWALVEGMPEENVGTWTDWMRKLPDRALSEVTESTDPAAQWAELDFRVLARGNRVSLLEVHLKTGRTHQIRLQASTRGWPIIGDAEYGSQIGFGEAFDDHRRRAIALHARTIDFWHPKLHHPVIVNAPVPATWHQFAAEKSMNLLTPLDTNMV
jgi:23S rRNA pseudouridine1911/1915/1917 synthase